MFIADQIGDTVETTHVVMILDESGSMAIIRSEVVDGVNAYLSSLREQSDVNYRFTLVKFDTDRYEKVFDHAPLEGIKFTDYMPSGGTPLFEAVGS